MKKLILFSIILIIISCRQEVTNKEVLLYPIIIDGKTGYINNNFNVVIYPKFEEGFYFSEGFARVKIDGKYAIINKNGFIENKYDFDLIGDMHNGFIRFCKSGKIGFVDRKGKVLIYGLSDARDFSEAKAAVKNKKWYYIDIKGHRLSSKEYDVAFDFHEGMAVVYNEGKCGVINEKSDFIIDQKYSRIDKSFSENLCYAEAYNEDDVVLNGYINKKGETIIPITLTANTSFYNNHAYVATGHVPKPLHWSLIDNTGRIIKENLPIDMINNFSEGVVSVGKYIGKNYKMGYMDFLGNFIIEPQFDRADNFINGLGLVYNNDKQIAFINKNGEIIYIEDIKKNMN
jgi:hypothetical protein